jgi:hypothetical protein
MRFLATITLLSNKEIGEIVDASESTFLQEFIS